jgi:hypothetical protein
MRLRLNGWQRIGIVLSAVWFFGFAVLSENNVRQIWFSYNIDMSICDARLQYWKDKGEGKEGPWTEYQLADYKQCRYDGYKFYRDVMGRMFAIDLGTLIAAWLVAWLGIVSVRWIRRGFA